MILSKNQRVQMYDIIYNEADALFKKVNPCKFKDGKCARWRDRANYSWYPGDGEPHCCMRCKHHGRNGCRVKSLGCKLWVCRRIDENYPELCAELSVLERFAFTLRLYAGIRRTKAVSVDAIKHLLNSKESHHGGR